MGKDALTIEHCRKEFGKEVFINVGVIQLYKKSVFMSHNHTFFSSIMYGEMGLCLVSWLFSVNHKISSYLICKNLAGS